MYFLFKYSKKYCYTYSSVQTFGVSKNFKEADQQGSIKLIKCDSKDNVAKCFFRKMLLFWTFYSSQNLEKKNLSKFLQNCLPKKEAIFNIDEKCFLSTKSAY